MAQRVGAASVGQGMLSSYTGQSPALWKAGKRVKDRICKEDSLAELIAGDNTMLPKDLWALARRVWHCSLIFPTNRNLTPQQLSDFAVPGILITQGLQGVSSIRSWGHFCFCPTSTVPPQTSFVIPLHLSYPTNKMRTVTFALLGKVFEGISHGRGFYSQNFCHICLSFSCCRQLLCAGAAPPHHSSGCFPVGVKCFLPVL